jgi:hypothetical protein
MGIPGESYRFGIKDDAIAVLNEKRREKIK